MREIVSITEKNRADGCPHLVRYVLHEFRLDLKISSRGDELLPKHSVGYDIGEDTKTAASDINELVHGLNHISYVGHIWHEYVEYDDEHDQSQR